MQRLTSLAAALAMGSLIAAGCGRSERATTGSREANEPPGARADASAERQPITLTGCVQRGTAPGTFILASTATAGVTGGGGEARRELPRDVNGQERSAPDKSTDTSRAQLASASSYRLMPSANDDLGQYENKRVSVRGRLAAETPVGTSGTTPAEGHTVDSSATNATVAGSAPQLRGFQVVSVDVVADSCEASGK
jgi:hypothetical protein